MLKNELAAGVLPCGRFGSNAAWLPSELLRARPKQLHFLVFAQPGKFVRHARQLKLRLLRAWRRISSWDWAFAQLPLPAPS